VRLAIATGIVFVMNANGLVYVCASLACAGVCVYARARRAIIKLSKGVKLSQCVCVCVYGVRA